MIHWLGQFHPVILHFSIALVIMTVVAELLWYVYRNPLYDHAAQFMIVSAAVFTPITALTGWAFSVGNQYAEMQINFFEWHEYGGIASAILTVITAVLRELYSQKGYPTLRYYYILLAVLFVGINTTSFLGGYLTFGPGPFEPLFR